VSRLGWKLDGARRPTQPAHGTRMSRGSRSGERCSPGMAMHFRLRRWVCSLKRPDVMGQYRRSVMEVCQQALMGAQQGVCSRWARPRVGGRHVCTGKPGNKPWLPAHRHWGKRSGAETWLESPWPQQSCNGVSCRGNAGKETLQVSGCWCCPPIPSETAYPLDPWRTATASSTMTS
jgi:hypothetical protein